MLLFRRRSDGAFPIGEKNLKMLHPEISFPTPLTQEAVAFLGYDIVNATIPPSCEILQKVILEECEEIDGKFYEKYTIKDIFEDLKDEEGNITKTKAEQEAEYLVSIKKAQVPASISMRQARLAMVDGGFYSTVLAQVQNLDDRAQIEWEYASTVERSSALVDVLGSALGLSDSAIDDLFIAASKL